jgi:hypothetical protein
VKALKSVFIWSIISVMFASLGAYLTWQIGCFYTDATPLCRHDYGGGIVALAGAVLVIGPLAYTARQRALRAVGRGMYARPMARSGGGWMQNVIHFVVEGELDNPTVGDEQRGWHPHDIPPGHGWRVPLEDGAEVIVYFEDFRTWLYEAWELQDKAKQSGKLARQGATSQRTWDGQIGRDQVNARNYLLDVAGALRRNRAAPNATRRIRGTPWRILERLVAEWPPESL